MEDLDLHALGERVARLADWHATLSDSRLSDAPYVTVTIEIPSAVDEQVIGRLQTAFAGLPRMRVLVWQRGRRDIPLEDAASETLQ